MANDQTKIEKRVAELERQLAALMAAVPDDVRAKAADHRARLD